MRNSVELLYANIEFSVNTKDADYDTSDETPGGSDFITGFDCATCVMPVSPEILEDILWLTNDELYVVRKANTIKTIEEAKSAAIRRAENHRGFIRAEWIDKIEDVKPGMPCRTWSVLHGDYETGIVTTIESGDITIVTDRGNLIVHSIRDVWFGATTETVGGYTVITARRETG